MVQKTRQRGTGTTPRLALLASAVALCAASVARAAEPDWTVVTLARDGSWGVGRASAPGQAIAGAVRDCKAMAAAPSDCGAEFRATRGGWIVAKLCGDRTVIATGKTRDEAERAALRREAELKSLYAGKLPPCTPVVTVAPDRTFVAPGMGETAQR